MTTKYTIQCLAKAATRPVPTTSRACSSVRPNHPCTKFARCFSDAPTRTTPISSSSRRHRPTLHARSSPITSSTAPTVAQAKRTIFIQTEETPNADALKFNPNHAVLPDDFPSSFLEYLSPRATLAPPHPSPLAAQLMNVDGVTSVFYGKDYITVTKDSGTLWAHVKPEVFALITEAVTAGQPIVSTVAGGSKSGEEQNGEQGSAASDAAPDYAPEDEEVVGMIQELLETRIRPAIQEDGGDIEFRGFRDGEVLLKLRGACRTCDSSTVTLKNGIESMLMHYIEEVKGVRQVLDQEEEIAMQEFAKFEEKLKAQKSGGEPGNPPPPSASVESSTSPAAPQ